MPKVEIIVNGEAYPCRPTMGAMLRFKQETGKEVTEITGNDFSDLCVYLYCCIVSACAKEGKEFNYSLLDFADSIGPEDMTEWTKQLQGTADNAGEAEKKS